MSEMVFCLFFAWPTFGEGLLSTGGLGQELLALRDLEAR